MTVRNYSLAGPDTAAAHAAGLVDADWFLPTIDPGRLRTLQRRSNARAGIDTALWVVLLLGSAWLAWWSLGTDGVIWWQDLGRTDTGPHQRNVTVFADGEVDRSPCGSGTSARLALLDAEGTLGDGEVLTHESIIGTTFSGRSVERVVDADRPAIITEISGMAYPTGEHAFTLDERDPVGRGFVLR